MFCPHCGQAVARDAKFCGACGGALIEGVTREVEGYHAGMALAGFWPRAGALLVDTVVVWLAAGVSCAVPFGAAIAIAPTVQDSNQASDALWIVGVIGMMVAGFGLTWRFHARGTSPGARVAHVRIVDRVGNAPGIGRGLVRMLVAMFLSGNLLSLGHLWMLGDREKRTWHDHLAGTWVVKDQ